MSQYRIAFVVAAAVFLAGCATTPRFGHHHALERQAVAGTDKAPPAPLAVHQAASGQVADAASTANVKIGNGVFVRPLPTPAPHAGMSESSSEKKNGVVFNFEDQPIKAVVKVVLGDFLKRNYAIGPKVKGSITFSTAQPVPREEAVPILQNLLAWTGNALIKQDGHYLVLRADHAVAGNLSPTLGAQPPSTGLGARLFPLHYISATQMQKLLKTFAPKSAFLLVDSQRNVLVMSGTPTQLANYQRTIQTFDVDWLKGMSVGVFTLQHASVEQLMPQLDKLFGPDGSTPLAGMLRFIPIQRTNAIVVITSQPDYLREVHEWIKRIDSGGGNRPRLYVYDVKNMLATELAGYLSRIYHRGGGFDTAGQAGGVAPGLAPSTLTAAGSPSGGGLRGDAALAGPANGGTGTESLTSSGSQPATAASGGGQATAGVGAPPSRLAGGGAHANGDRLAFNGPKGIRITAVNANNQLLVRCRPSQWSDLQAAIQRLDVVPLQVQIQTRILEVSLTGKFSLGVQWYLEGLIGGHPDKDGGFVPGQPGNQQQLALGNGGVTFHPLQDSFFYSFVNSNLQVALHAMESSGNTKILSEPSLVVMNNQLAHIQVGKQIPVNQTYFAPGVGSGVPGGGIATLGSVQYKNTGVILQVRPRVNPGGLVYLSVNQIVSKPGVRDQFGNFPIDKREIATRIAVQSGQTVLLGGLIQQARDKTRRGVPWLSRIPVIGRLFGGTSRQNNRTELLILITPRVISSSSDARAITLQYEHQFQSLKPLRAGQSAPAPKTDAGHD